MAAAFLTIALSACASHQQTSGMLHATIVAGIEESCDQPGVRIDTIKQLAPKREIQVAGGNGPVNVEPGRYEIAVACQNSFGEKSRQCVYWGHPNEYPTYHVLLKAGTSYSFRCFVEGHDLLYRISEAHSPEQP